MIGSIAFLRRRLLQLARQNQKQRLGNGNGISISISININIGVNDTQQYRFKSSSSSSSYYIPEAVREVVKSSLLNEAIKSDSIMWQTTETTTTAKATATATATATTDSNHDSNNVPFNGQNNKDNNDNHHRVNGQSYNHNSNNNNNNNNIHGINGYSSSSSSTIHHTTIPALQEDTLDHWHLDDKPKYWPNLPPDIIPQHQGADPFLLSRREIDSLATTIRQNLLGTDHPVLNRAASYFFQDTAGDGGKKVRPMMVMLLSRALSDHAADASANANTGDNNNQTSPSLFSEPSSFQRHDLPQAQRRLAEISELIHTASLFHDDVIDEAETRRGLPAVHQLFGNKMAILGGDYLLARASIGLARLRQVDVVECMSTIIEHLVRGEVMQIKKQQSDSNTTWEQRFVYYLRKNYYKTASLMANSCRSAALLGNYDAQLVDCAYQYGKHIGMAFQLVDDILDFEGTNTGKPSLSDLRSGIATAPVLYALAPTAASTTITPSSSSTQLGLLQEMIHRKFSNDGDVERAVEFVYRGHGIQKTKELAQVHAELAMDAVLRLRPGPYRDSLVHLAYKVVDRTR